MALTIIEKEIIQDLARVLGLPEMLIVHTVERMNETLHDHLELQALHRHLTSFYQQIAKQRAMETVAELRPGWQIQTAQDATPREQLFPLLPATYYFAVYSETEGKQGIDMVRVTEQGDVQVQSVDALVSLQPENEEEVSAG